MTIYRERALKLDKVSTYPLASRKSKVSVDAFGRVPKRDASVREWVKSLPRILAGESFRGVIEALQAARRARQTIIWGLGGHAIKVGLGPILIHLMERSYATAFALNGAALIHDFEIALVGSTSEDVPAALGKGQFGMAEETGRYLNEAIAAGDGDDLGIGEAVGRFLTGKRPPLPVRYRQHSLLAAAYRSGTPVTVHEAIGTDIIHNHPAIDARALGSATHRDFRLLAALVKQMSRGGIYLNCGSAVVLPEVFLKCVSLAANLGHPPRDLVTVNFDFVQHYRPTENVVRRPVAMARGKKSRGYAITGHHELLIPLLAAALE
ncbi:MAG TPA: hypothetical protein VGZ29_07105 [Terriglobia bacterium]|nr:hypothetical protein [Terriglobia bacterium]